MPQPLQNPAAPAALLVPPRSPQKPMSPLMRAELDSLQFRPKRSSAYGGPPTPPPRSPGMRAPAAASPKANLLQPLHKGGGGTSLLTSEMMNDKAVSFDSVYDSRFDGKDTEDHFGMGMNLRNDADLTTRIGKTKQIGSSEFINDRRATFDIVYSSAHDGMDTADHFSVGMQMGADEYDLQMEERARERMAAYAVAKENLKKNKLHEHAHMGHEQAEGKGDTFDHFAGGSMNIEADDTNMAFDKIYSEVFTGKDTADHFAPGMGMSLAADAELTTRIGTSKKVGSSESINDRRGTFDIVYSSAHDGMDTESSLVGMAVTPTHDVDIVRRRQKRYPNLTKAERVPPPRPKFLQGSVAHWGPSGAPNGKDEPEVPPTRKVLSAEMQRHVDGLVVKGSGLGGKAEPMSTASVFLEAPSAEELVHKYDKFSWDSERIAFELINKFDMFTRRREDHLRKILVSIGNDPAFESTNKNAISITPKNFNRVCDRFGIVCNERQAREIFQKHNMPMQGCNLYTVGRAFIEGNAGGLEGGPAKKQVRLQPEVKAARMEHTVQQASRRGDPFATARLMESAWKVHHSARAQTAPAATLPPIG